MTSKIKVDNINKVSDDSNIINKCGTTITVGVAGNTTAVAGNIVKSNALQAADGGNIISQSGTTITLGASGDSVVLACSATQSGFGRSGSVNWETTKKTTGFTATSGEGYFCDTSGGGFTLTLPATPAAGDIVALKDYAGSFSDNNLTIGRNSSNLNGNAEDSVQNVNFTSLTLVYVDATKGWIPTEQGVGNIGFVGMSATGGTITCVGNDRIHTFTSPGTFTVNCTAGTPEANTVSYMVVGGGGGWGQGWQGAGGAGGYREYKAPLQCYTASPLNGNPGGTAITVTQQGYPVTIGAAGVNRPVPCGHGNGTAGSPSTFGPITSTGGGYGGGAGNPGGAGGSGGGAGGPNPGPSGGAGNTPPVTPSQGFPGGNKSANGYGAGGGGATSAGCCTAGDFGGGGDGTGTAINPAPGVGTPGPCGSLRYYAGGAGGGPQGSGIGQGGEGGGGANAGIVIIRYKNK